MKTGRYPIASIVLLILCLAKFVVWYFYPEKKAELDPWFDNIMLGAVIVFLLYYIRVWVGTWFSNRRERIEQE